MSDILTYIKENDLLKVKREFNSLVNECINDLVEKERTRIAQVVIEGEEPDEDDTEDDEDEDE